MFAEIVPEPSEAERKAILAALALEQVSAPAGAWSQATASGDDPLPEQPGGDPGVVEP